MFYEGVFEVNQKLCVTWENQFSAGEGDWGERNLENYLFWLKADKIFFSKSSKSMGLGT